MKFLWVVLSVQAVLASTSVATDAELHHQEHPASSPILAYYDFERSVPSGPDTFWVREAGEAEVALSSVFRYNGERALHISEVPENRDFAEFLAYIRNSRDGAVFIQFYLLLTDPDQRFNFGLAGSKWFLSTERNGQAIWLQTADGFFRHRSRDGWDPLFEPRSFVWYFVDVVYHVDKGVYDLALFEEGIEEAMIDLRQVPSMNGHRSSAVKYFSLIGDLEDAGRFDFFVDDLLIATDPEVRLKPFVAPGRRRYFVDMLAIDATPSLDGLGDQTETDALDQLEAAADQAFRVGDLDQAEMMYESLRSIPDRSLRMQLKLADIRHLRGDVEGERELRESIYGRLELEEEKTGD